MTSSDTLLLQDVVPRGGLGKAELLGQFLAVIVAVAHLKNPLIIDGRLNLPSIIHKNIYLSIYCGDQTS